MFFEGYWSLCAIALLEAYETKLPKAGIACNHSTPTRLRFLKLVLDPLQNPRESKYPESDRTEAPAVGGSDPKVQLLSRPLGCMFKVHDYLSFLHACMCASTYCMHFRVFCGMGGVGCVGFV